MILTLKTIFIRVQGLFYANKYTKRIKGVGNEILIRGNTHNVLIDCEGNNNKIIIGENTSVNNVLIYIRGNDHSIILKDNCYIGGGELWIEDSNGSIVIHENTTIEKAHLAVTEPNSKIEIHKDCMLANFVEIRTGDSHSIIDLTTNKRINYAANVTLEEHVWVGAHAKILKGVTIGHNSVVATNAVVIKSIPPHSITAGLPAKVVKSNIDWKRERIYQ